MTERTTLARPYAMAAFKQAQEENKLDEWSNMLRFLSMVVRDPTMLGIASHPRVAKERVTTLLFDIGEGKLSETGRNFLRVLIEHHRLSLLPEIAAVFEQERAAFEQRREVAVLTAYRLQSKYQQAIKDAMTKRLGQEVELSVQIDRSLIGGVIIRAGDMVIDASLRGRISQLGLNLS
jgi:F-type H+-transporting ATPase subunit delta